MSEAVSGSIHALASDHLPFFVTQPGQTDVLLVGTSVFLVFAVVAIGVFYFRLHALPEQMAHRGQKVQFEIVAVLVLISLFTHNHLFWIAALLLALIPLPDLSSPLKSMAQSLGRMAGEPVTTSPAFEAAPQVASADLPVIEHAGVESDPTGEITPPVPLDEHRTRSAREV